MASTPSPDPSELPPYPGSYIPDQITSDGPQIGPPDPVQIPDESEPEREIDHGPEDEKDDEFDAVDNDSDTRTVVADAGDVSGGDDTGGGGDVGGGDGGGGNGDGSGDN
jgi:hypothetical protein